MQYLAELKRFDGEIGILDENMGEAGRDRVTSQRQIRDRDPNACLCYVSVISCFETIGH